MKDKNYLCSSMNTLQIEGTLNSPGINFNPNNGLLKIIGRSIPENPVKFYQPIEVWLIDFIASNPDNLELYIYLDYLNTHSTECILILLKKIETYFKNANKNVKVSWCFDEDDEDMQGLGEDLASITGIPFEYKEIIED